MRTDELRKLSNRAINECMYSDFYAATKPEQVIVLLDEIDRLKSEAVAADFRIANDVAVIVGLTAERNAAQADVKRLEWVLPILSLSDDNTADERTTAIGRQLIWGLTGRTAIDAAMRGEQP